MPGFSGSNCGSFGTVYTLPPGYSGSDFGEYLAISENFLITSTYPSPVFFYALNPLPTLIYTFTGLPTSGQEAAIASNGVVLVSAPVPNGPPTLGVVYQFFCNATNSSCTYIGQLPPPASVVANELNFGSIVDVYDTTFLIGGLDNFETGIPYVYLYSCFFPTTLCTLMNSEAGYSINIDYASGGCLTENIIVSMAVYATPVAYFYAYNSSGISASFHQVALVGYNYYGVSCIYNATTGISTIVFPNSYNQVWLQTCTGFPNPACSSPTVFTPPNGFSSSKFGQPGLAINSYMMVIGAFDINSVFVYFDPTNSGSAYTWTGGFNDLLPSGYYGISVALADTGVAAVGAYAYDGSGAFVFGAACPFGLNGTNCSVNLTACTTTRCLNGGTCTPLSNGSFTCRCPLGYNGTTCSGTISSCTVNPCKNGGSCFVNGTGYACACVTGYNGTNCTNNFSGCLSSPCNQNQTCTPILGGSYTCACLAGYNGTNCTNNYAGCIGNANCQNGGTCVPVLGGAYQCACVYGYGGLNCLDNLSGCFTSPCVNGGTCAPVPGGLYNCTCPFGYGGVQCQVNVCGNNPCSPNNMTCVPTSAQTYSCVCPPGSYCSPYAQHYIGYNSTQYGQYGQTVAAGPNFYAVSSTSAVYVYHYLNATAYQELAPIAPGASFLVVSLAWSSSNILFIGLPGEVGYSGAVFAYQCLLSPVSCVYLYQVPTPATVYQNNFGTSISVDSIGSRLLISAPDLAYAVPRWYLFSFSNTSCAQIVEGAAGYSSIAYGDATALSVNYLLISDISYSGDAGRVYQFSISGSTVTLLGQVTSQTANAEFGYSMDSYYNATSQTTYFAVGSPGTNQVFIYAATGSGTAMTLLMTLSPPDGIAQTFGHAVAIESNTVVIGSPDSYGRVYVFTALDYAYPSANPMWNSIGGETFNNYQQSLGTSVSISSGHAIAGNPASSLFAATAGAALGNFICPLGFNGTHCEFNFAGCLQPGACANGGTCLPGNGNGIITCICAPGYNGTTCQNNYSGCLSGPCLGGATCHPLLNGYQCICPTGVNGTLCQDNYSGCLSSPCGGNGVCSPINGGNFSCFCSPGYNGTTCSNNYSGCNASPCLHGGSCTPVLGGSFACACPASYNGTVCQNNYAGCLAGPCLGGGTCTPTNGSFTCACPPYYSGPTCGTQPCENSPCPWSGYQCIPGGYTSYSCQCPSSPACPPPPFSQPLIGYNSTTGRGFGGAVATNGNFYAVGSLDVVYPFYVNSTPPASYYALPPHCGSRDCCRWRREPRVDQ